MSTEKACSIGNQSSIYVELRSEMKRQLLSAIKSEPSPLNGTAFDGGALVMYGSSLMLAARESGVHFPIHGRKAGDIDLFIEHAKEQTINMNPDRFAAEYKKVMGPFMKKVTESLGYTLSSEKKNGTLEESYGETFVVKNTFSANQVESILKAKNVEINDTTLGAVDEYMEVDMVPLPPLSLLNPQQTEYLSGETPILIDAWPNFLASALARSITPIVKSPTGFVLRGLYQQSNEPYGFKPRDLVDVFNIVNAKPGLVDLSSEKDSDITLLRVLMVVLLARLGKNVNDLDLTNFDPTPENIVTFQNNMEGKLTSEFELSANITTDILQTYQRTIRKIFPEHNTELGESSIQLKQEELDFLTAVQGFTLSKDEGLKHINPEIRADSLKELYSSAFAKNPELHQRIKEHPTLRGIGDRIIKQRTMGF